MRRSPKDSARMHVGVRALLDPSAENETSEPKLARCDRCRSNYCATVTQFETMFVFGGGVPVSCTFNVR